jgi:hypothetical protein
MHKQKRRQQWWKSNVFNSKAYIVDQHSSNIACYILHLVQLWLLNMHLRLFWKGNEINWRLTILVFFLYLISWVILVYIYIWKRGDNMNCKNNREQMIEKIVALENYFYSKIVKVFFFSNLVLILLIVILTIKIWFCKIDFSINLWILFESVMHEVMQIEKNIKKPW